jgi:hypothetical protein
MWKLEILSEQGLSTVYDIKIKVLSLGLSGYKELYFNFKSIYSYKYQWNIT